jgi:hypothetical protein
MKFAKGEQTNYNKNVKKDSVETLDQLFSVR